MAEGTASLRVLSPAGAARILMTSAAEDRARILRTFGPRGPCGVTSMGRQRRRGGKGWWRRS